jgi:adenylate cyclase, class 2
MPRQRVYTSGVTPNETEIKFLVHDLEQLRKSLVDAGFREVTPRTHEMNTLFDTPGHDLQKRGELLRIRKYGYKWLLTHKSKGQSSRHKSRVEIETEVADGEKLDTIFRSLGYEPSFRYEKFRAEWSDHNGHVVVDETPIGNIAEIEGDPAWIDPTAEKLGINEKDYITKNYATLFFEWKAKTGSPAREMTWAEIGSERK